MGETPEAPKHIWLQDGCEEPQCQCRPETYDEGVTWCADQINANDSKYIRFDLHERELEAERNAVLEKAAKVCGDFARTCEQTSRGLPNATDRLRMDDRRDAGEQCATAIRALKT